MKNKLFLAGMISMALVFGFMIIGCSDGSSGGDGGAKTLVITGFTVAQMAEGSDGGFIGVFPAGTPETNVYADIMAYGTGVGSVQYSVAGMEFDEIDAPVFNGSTYTITVPLYNLSGNPWTGSGTYDIYNAISDGSRNYVYKAANVSITSATTTISASLYTKIYDEPI